VYDYGEGAARPIVTDEPPQPGPARVIVRGDVGPVAPLVERFARGGAAIDHAKAHPGFPGGALDVDGTFVALTDGRTATARAAAAGLADVVVFDLALDYGQCARLALAPADGCSAAGWSRAVGALQAAGVAVVRFDDVAGLAVMRTVAMLANEAADAVTQGIASAADVDVAMQRGVNYPRGPLAWADAIGLARMRDTLVNLAAHYGEPRYRLSPLIARRAAGARPLAA
jgi:3-hydroxybutyryl-CoA dehydrogenase